MHALRSYHEVHTELADQQTPKTNTNTADLIQIHFSLFMKVEVAEECNM